MNPSATPRGGMLGEQSPLTSYVPKTCIEVCSEHAPINVPSKRNIFNTDIDDVPTVVASDITDTIEAGQLTSPLFSQERELSSNPFGVSGSQQQ